MKQFFCMRDYVDAALILSELKVKSDCFNPDGTVVRARYLVCIDDDITSAFYAMYLYRLIHKTYGYYPFLLCVGGTGPLSKHLNEEGVSEGMKQRMVCLELGARAKDITVLDHGTNTGLNCLDVYKHVVKSCGKVIFCVTTRLSLRLERTFAFLSRQYPTEVRLNQFEALKAAGVHWYVPHESLSDMMQAYNCKGLAKGVMFLAEVASIYDRIVRYSGKIQAPLDFEVSDKVVEASQRLARKYPLKINALNFTGIWQYVYALSTVLFFKPWIKSEVRMAIKQVKNRLREEFD